MRVGILEQYSKEKVEERQKAGESVVVGVEAETLLDQINELEIRHGYNLANVLCELKADLMIVLGKLELRPSEPEKKEENNVGIAGPKGKKR